MFGKRSNPGPSVAPAAAVSLTQHVASAPQRAASAVPEISRTSPETSLPAPLTPLILPAPPSGAELRSAIRADGTRLRRAGLGALAPDVNP